MTFAFEITKWQELGHTMGKTRKSDKNVNGSAKSLDVAALDQGASNSDVVYEMDITALAGSLEARLGDAALASSG